MDNLEKLYNCARDHLENPVQDWAGFGKCFKAIFGTHLLFYYVENDETGWQEDSLKIIATTHPRLVEMFLEFGLHRQSQVKESELASLEPSRRTDRVADEEFRMLGEYYDFFVNNGMFYMMIVPAQLAPQKSLSLVVWREESAGDFDEREKMRLGLFVRYLVKIFDASELTHTKENTEIEAFGQKYALTKTETEILSYLLEGYPVRKIAEETNRTYGTVRWHVHNLLEKCHVPDQKNLLRQFYQLIKN